MTLRAVSSVASMIIDGIFTVDTLPDPSAYVDKYARVSDLFGDKRDLVLASQDQSGFYWQPVRPVYKKVIPLSSDMSLIPMKVPSVITLTGSVPLGVNRVMQLSTQNVFPGATFLVKTKLSSLLGTVKILDPVSSLLSQLAVNNSYELIYDPVNGWEQF